MILDWVELIVPTEEQFIRSISSLSDDIDSSDEIQPVAYAMPQTIISKLKDLSLDTLTDAFLKDAKSDKKRNVNTYNLVSNIEYLTQLNSQVAFTYDEYNKRSVDLLNKWNEIYGLFIDSINISPYLRDYKQIMSDWKKDMADKTFFIGVNIKYLGLMFDMADEKNDTNLLQFINRLQVIVRQSNVPNKGYARVFKSIADLSSVALNSLKRSSEYFRII